LGVLFIPFLTGSKTSWLKILEKQKEDWWGITARKDPISLSTPQGIKTPPDGSLALWIKKEF
jgi:hypothetical protein